MPNKSSLPAFSVFAIISVIGTPAFGHTEVRDIAVEGKLSRNAIEIEHGCETTSGKSLPVIAQSLILPTLNPLVTRSDGTTTSLIAETTVPSLEGLLDLPQNKDIFKKQAITQNHNGNSVGINGTQGNLQTGLKGVVPLHFGPLWFQAKSCAKSLKIELAIADLCKKTFPPRGASANTWIPRVTAKFSDAGNEGIGAPAILTVNRDLNANPLSPGCGDGYEVTVSPSNEDIDTNLVFKGWGK